MDNNSLVPRLRFKEFSGEWEEKKLGDLTNLISERNKENKKLPIYSISNVAGFIPQSEQFEGVDSHTRGYDISLYKIIRNNTFAYNPARINVGSIGYSYDLNDFLISSLYVCFKTKEELEDIYLLHFLKTERFNRAVEQNVEGGIRSYLFYANFSNIDIHVPSTKLEQQKIADTLSSLDTLIQSEQAKLTQLQEHKKGLMQNLFPQEGESVPKVRFKEFEKDGEWEEHQIGKHIDLLTGIALKSNEITGDNSGTPILRGINITEGHIRHSEDIDRFYLGDTETISRYLTKEKDIVIGMDGSKVGKNVALISSRDENSILIQRVARIRAKNTMNIRFLYQHFISNKFITYVDMVNTSSGIPHISAKQIGEFEISIPATKKEQQKIASTLSSLDDLISSQTKRIELLQQHKKGLMQGLFPSAQ